MTLIMGSELAVTRRMARGFEILEDGGLLPVRERFGLLALRHDFADLHLANSNASISGYDSSHHWCKVI